MVWLPDGEKSLIIAVSTEYRHVRDGRTDGHTDIYRQHSLLYV